MSFRAIIVGGSVTGLSLAIMLEELGIDYMLLEGHQTIAPQLGASICMLPNGLRILDQLGCYEAVREKAGDFYNRVNLRDADGHAIAQPKPISLAKRLEEKTGYPCVFLDRQYLLQVLHDRIKQKDKILTGKRVASIDITSYGVEVRTNDGSIYAGDFLVGADGVHSTVRKEMWRLGNQRSPGLFPSEEYSKLTSRTKCIFGISARPAKFPYNTQEAVFCKGYGYTVVSAPGDRVYWFMFCTAKKSCGTEIPRYTKEDEASLVRQHMSDRITEAVTFGDIYNNRQITTLVPLEEHIFARWYFRRIITIGDSAHKVHPITAQGGNGAIESAACLINAISRRMHAFSQALSEESLEAAFFEVQQNRYNHAKRAMKQGEQVQYIIKQETFCSELVVRFLLPFLGDKIFLDSFISNSVAGSWIEKMKLPQRLHPIPSNRGCAFVAEHTKWIFWAVGILVSALTVTFCLT